MKRNDIILIVGILFISAVSYLGYSCFFQEKEVVVVHIDGKIYGTYTLDKNQVIEIDDTNILYIENASCWMSDANCPDHLCVKQGIISKAGESIICLPNRVIVTIEGSEIEMIDAVVK